MDICAQQVIESTYNKLLIAIQGIKKLVSRIKVKFVIIMEPIISHGATLIIQALRYVQLLMEQIVLNLSLKDGL